MSGGHDQPGPRSRHAFTKFIVLTRAAVLPMTLVVGLLAGLRSVQERSLTVTCALTLGYYLLLVVAIAVQTLPWPVLIDFASLPTVRTVWKPRRPPTST